MANILTKQIMEHIVQKCAKDLASEPRGTKPSVKASGGSHLTERHAAMLSELLNKKTQADESAGSRGVRATDLNAFTQQANAALPSRAAEPAGARNANVVHGRAVSLDELLGRLK